MNDLTFKFDLSFEVLDVFTAKVFVNDEYVGRVKNSLSQLTFRCSDNPYKNVVPRYENNSQKPMSALINDRYFLRSLMPVVLRNYLRNFSYLADVLPAETDFEPVDFPIADKIVEAPSLTPEEIAAHNAECDAIFAKLQSLARNADTIHPQSALNYAIFQA